MEISPLYFMFTLTLVTYIPTSISLPFLVFHGIGQKCTDKSVSEFTKQLSEWSAAEGYCILCPSRSEGFHHSIAQSLSTIHVSDASIVDSSHGRLNSWILPLEDQTTIACNKVKQMKELNQGYHIVGLSQGNLIARAVIEFCDGAPPAKNFISLAGPHAGTGSAPFCLFKFVYAAAAKLIKFGIYRKFFQNNLAVSGYFKIPNYVDVYLDNSKFLPKLNNEIPNERISTYKERFKSLENLVLIKFDHEKVLNPKETSWFGYYPNDSFCSVLPPQQTKLYVEDWIGLRALDEAGKVKYVSVPGNHLAISQDDMKKYIVPYLKYSRTIQQIDTGGEIRHCPNELSAVMLKNRDIF